MNRMKQTRNTAQRQLVRKILDNNYQHPTADEVYEIARKENPTISRATIYRNLHLLSRTGEIVHHEVPIGPGHFDFRTNEHYHFLCKKCCRLIDTQVPYRTDLDQCDLALPDCRVEGHRLLFIGLCGDCQTQEN